LICLIGSFVVTNDSPYRTHFLQILHDVGPPVYVVFFTLTGTELQVDVFVEVWVIALLLFVVRIVTIFIASYAGGFLAGDPAQHNRLSWMT
jgi:Kef-type K+ transport system membrane component KefB